MFRFGFHDPFEKMLRRNFACILVLVLFFNPFLSNGETGTTSIKKLKSSSIVRDNNLFAEFNIAKNPICSEELSKICTAEMLSNNLNTMMCVQSFQKIDQLDLSDKCQHLIWDYKKNMTIGNQFLQLSVDCKKELNKFPDCMAAGSGYILSCMIEYKDNITMIPCKKFLEQMGTILFSNYRLIDRFASSCSKDISRLKCGRLTGIKDPLFGQGDTIDCLARSAMELDPSCQEQVFHVKRLQGSDFHLDRPLYFACRDDREKFCSKTHNGQGRVLKCLMKHIGDRHMSDSCLLKLQGRQKLIVEDYKVSKRLAHECKSEIHKYQCKKSIGSAKIKLVRLSRILLCLEGVIHEGKPVSGNCQAEMHDHRKMLMSDYSLSPDLASNCHRDIEKFCRNQIEPGSGKVISCLMEHSKGIKKQRVTTKCLRSLEDLIQVVDAGEDWRVDTVLKKACLPVASMLCQDVQGGDAEVLMCLMGHRDSEHMLEDCRNKLLQIQYFVARDYKLDPHLFKACRKNAAELCHAQDHWWNDPKTYDVERGPLILPCLFRHAYHPIEHTKLTGECIGEVKRVMRERAISVHLHPEIEDMCINDLAEFCIDQVKEGEELSCLQLKLEDLSKDCKTVIEKYTEEEGEHIDLNYELSKVCSSVFDRYCSDLLSKNVDEGEMLQCLIEHKNKPDVKSNTKCRTSIERFQLIELKDYRFSPLFKLKCQKHVVKYCPDVKTKYDVVDCLSAIHTQDVLKDSKKPKLSRECTAQLRVELLEKNENIKLDPVLDKACKDDVTSFCSNLSPGEGKVIECLKDNAERLSKECHSKIFKIEQNEMVDNAEDYGLIMTCKRMIKQFCAEEDLGTVLDCLKHHRDNEDMDLKCRKEIVRRMITQSRDYRLNPSLQKSCVRDIPKFCAKVKGTGDHEDEYEGKVIQCLKDQYRKHRLSRDCELEIKNIIKDAALDYRQDPVLVKACKVEIKDLCSDDKAKSLSQGYVEECLKTNFKDEKIQNEECKQQIARILHESHVDIHSDPLLYRACAIDVKHYCVNIQPGEGRQLSCIMAIMESKDGHLMPDCQNLLMERKEMFELAAIVAPAETFQEVFAQISISPSRNYFFSVILVIIGTIFIVGLLFGRITKRVAAMAKNK